MDLYTVLWSATQKSFHVETFAETLMKGRKTFFQRTRQDYILLGMFATRREADQFLKKMEVERGRLYPVEEHRRERPGF